MRNEVLAQRSRAESSAAPSSAARSLVPAIMGPVTAITALATAITAVRPITLTTIMAAAGGGGRRFWGGLAGGVATRGGAAERFVDFVLKQPPRDPEQSVLGKACCFAS